MPGFVSEDDIDGGSAPTGSASADAGPKPSFIPEDEVPTGGSTGGGQPTESLSLLPFSRYPNQGWRFDPHAGLTAPIVSAIGLTGDVAQGRAIPGVDPRTIEAGVGASMVAQPDAIFKPGKPVAASSQELHTVGDGGYQVVGRMPVNYSLRGVYNMADGAQQGFLSSGVSSANAPQVHSILDGLRTPPTGATSVPMMSLESARRKLSLLTQSPNQYESGAARTALRKLDDFITNPTPANVVSGPAQQAADILTDARANKGAAFRSDRLNQVEQKADVASTAPGASYGRTLQARLRGYANAITDPLNPNRFKYGFNKEERDAIADAGSASAGQKTIHAVNKMVGEGGWLALAAEKAGPFGIPAVLGTKAAGAVLEHLGERAASGAFQRVDDLIRSRAPLSQQRAANPAEAMPGDWSFFGRSIRPQSSTAKVPSSVVINRALTSQGFGAPTSYGQPMIPATPEALEHPRELYD